MLNVFKVKKTGGHTQDSGNLHAQALPAVGSGGPARERILDTAIRMFRESGFDETTMREIASEAGVALGLAYYYFPSKEALVMAYYQRVQNVHAVVARQRLQLGRTFKERLGMLLQTKLDILADDRKLLGALFRYTGSPDHPLSFMGRATAPLRADCMGLFAEALAPERVPEDLRELAPLLLWALHMGVLLYFLYDPSPNFKHTRKLVDGSAKLAAGFLAMAKLPLLRPVRRNLLGLLQEAALMPEK